MIPLIEILQNVGHLFLLQLHMFYCDFGKHFQTERLNEQITVLKERVYIKYINSFLKKACKIDLAFFCETDSYIITTLK